MPAVKLANSPIVTAKVVELRRNIAALTVGPIVPTYFAITKHSSISSLTGRIYLENLPGLKIERAYEQSSGDLILALANKAGLDLYSSGSICRNRDPKFMSIKLGEPKVYKVRKGRKVLDFLLFIW